MGCFGEEICNVRAEVLFAAFFLTHGRKHGVEEIVTA